MYYDLGLNLRFSNESSVALVAQNHDFSLFFAGVIRLNLSAKFSAEKIGNCGDITILVVLRPTHQPPSIARANKNPDVIFKIQLIFGII
jgi:hypothetical protein